MEDNLDDKTGYVTCAQCGSVCELSSIPQLATDCSTMEGTQQGSTLEVVAEQPANKVLELNCDWTEPEEKSAA